MKKTILAALTIGGMAMIGGIAAWGQAQRSASNTGDKVDRGAAYYYFVLAHIYAEKALASGGTDREYVSKAMENFKAAVKADPSIPVTADELSGIYKRRSSTLVRPPAPPPPPSK